MGWVFYMYNTKKIIAKMGHALNYLRKWYEFYSKLRCRQCIRQHQPQKQPIMRDSF